MSRIKSISKKKLIFQKTNYRCYYCNIALTPKNWSIEHLKTKQCGGTDNLDNLVGACIPCNVEKGKRAYFRIYK